MTNWVKQEVMKVLAFFLVKSRELIVVVSTGNKGVEVMS